MDTSTNLVKEHETNRFVISNHHVVYLFLISWRKGPSYLELQSSKNVELEKSFMGGKVSEANL